ncbi:MAG: ABC transporter ATP-binding protein [Cyclobacteriaceae bacterium]|nr:ABC transporter ATP-binding protein [Cyclobacteriaceae bacterium]
MDSILPLATINLEIGYKGKKRVKIAGPLNFDVLQGSLYGLIGINGIGKSTLIKTLSGLLPPLGGQILINGQDIFSLHFNDRAKFISLVLTDRINAGLATVEEIVKMGRFPYTNWQFNLSSADQEAIEDALSSVDLMDKKDLLFDELSDGNKQKVMIAKALAQDTPVLILDEPTVHLDIKNRFIILQLLQKLAKEHNKTILFSGHDLDYMLTFCDQLMLMKEQELSIKSPEQFIKSGEITKAFDLDLLDLPNLKFKFT